MDHNASETPSSASHSEPGPLQLFTDRVIPAGGEATLPAPSGSEPTGDLRGLEDDIGSYWDATSMAPPNARSLAAISRLRAYKPPAFPVWDRLPVSRRAAVLILLYSDRQGDLRVVLTMRAASLRSFSGHAAFPGGKADTLQESTYEIARREAWEEIGLPKEDDRLPKPFRLEHLCDLPYSFARTELAVRPCVAFLHADVSPKSIPAPHVSVEPDIIPKLDAREVAAVFSGPFSNFLLAHDEQAPNTPEISAPHRALPPGAWYDGKWGSFYDTPWRVHYFHVPVDRQRVTKPKRRENGSVALAEHPEEEEPDDSRYLVWGMTGRMLVDAARVAYDREPEFEHNEHYGDEALIARLEAEGKLGEKERRSEVSETASTGKRDAAGSKM